MDLVTGIFLEFLKWFLKVQEVPHLSPWKWWVIALSFVGAYMLFKTYWRTRKGFNLDLCNKGQARITFKNLTELHRHKIENFFFRTHERVSLLNDLNNESLLNNFDDFFKGLHESGVDEMNHFAVNGQYLGQFIQDCSVEYNFIKNHLLQILMSENESERKEIPYFLKTKFESLNSSFGIWVRIKMKKGNEINEN